jgi:DNA invertase Pin-like site-specific DNA recombinase
MTNGGQQKPLRFAPLVRVSTETQKKKGESLKVQTEQLTEAIKSLGGTVAPRLYKGQEHATPEQERKILEELIEDAKAHKFDAVMVADLSRWSRDNHRSKADLKILKSNGIRFFVRTQEYDLNDPVQGFMVGINVEVAEFFARQQAYKSQLSRITRAKRDIPTSGKKPYGRKWNKEKAKWELLPEAKEKIEVIAKEYLKEDIDFETLGKKHGMNGSNLHKILTKRCSDTWTIRFKSPTQSKVQPYEEVTVKGVPRLLDEQTIRKIRAKCEARRT